MIRRDGVIVLKAAICIVAVVGMAGYAYGWYHGWAQGQAQGQLEIKEKLRALERAGFIRILRQPAPA